MWIKKTIWLIVLFFVIADTGCGRKPLEGERTPVAYEICLEKNLPEELREWIAERKQKKNTFSYLNSRYMYLVVCYGRKSQTGYDIEVKKVEKSDHWILVQLCLKGPGEQREQEKKESTPYIVLRCDRECCDGMFVVDY